MSYIDAQVIRNHVPILQVTTHTHLLVAIYQNLNQPCMTLTLGTQLNMLHLIDGGSRTRRMISPPAHCQGLGELTLKLCKDKLHRELC